VFPSSIIAQSPLKGLTIASYELVAAVQDHLRCVRAFGREPRSVDALSVGEQWRGVWILPA